MMVESLQTARQTLRAMAKKTQKADESGTYWIMVTISTHLIAQLREYFKCSCTTESVESIKQFMGERFKWLSVDV